MTQVLVEGYVPTGVHSMLSLSESGVNLNMLRESIWIGLTSCIVPSIKDC